MTKRKLVADSSANLCTLEGVDFTSVPLKIMVGEKEFVDNKNLEVSDLIDELHTYKGKSSTACPGVGDWLEAFDGADEVFGVAITSNLSGCYNSAALAAEQYTEEHPNAKVFILDSLSTGPEMHLILEKYRELINSGKTFEEIRAAIREYLSHTRLMFCLKSLNTLAKNGRVNPAVAKAAGLLGIQVVGRASDEGTLELLHKCRGEKKSLAQMIATMKELGFKGGKVRLSHTYNAEGAGKLAALIREHFPNCDLHIYPNRGLCSFYAEDGGLLLGFEC